MPDNYAVLAVKTIYQNINVWNTTNGDGPKASWNLICLCHKQQSSYFTKNKKKIAHKRTIFCISRRIYAEFRGEYMITDGCSWFTYFICIYWLPLFVFVGLMPNWMANISTIHITNNAHRSFTHSTDTKLPRAMRRVRNQATYIYILYMNKTASYPFRARLIRWPSEH